MSSFAMWFELSMHQLLKWYQNWTDNRVLRKSDSIKAL